MMQAEAEMRAKFYIVVLMRQDGFSEMEIADTLESLTKQEQKKS